MIPGFIAALALLAPPAAPPRMQLAVERQGPAGWSVVDAALVFSPDDHIRFRFSASFDGWLYVMNRSTSGAYELLFPRPDTGEENRIQAGKDYLVPATQGWFRVAGPPGHDVVYWLVSPLPLNSRIAPPPATAHPPASFRPRCDDAFFKSRGDCIDPSAGVKPAGLLPENLNGIARPRGLTFSQKKDGTVVAAPGGLAGPVIYELRLAHN